MIQHWAICGLVNPVLIFAELTTLLNRSEGLLSGGADLAVCNYGMVVMLAYQIYCKNVAPDYGVLSSFWVSMSLPLGGDARRRVTHSERRDGCGSSRD